MQKRNPADLMRERVGVWVMQRRSRQMPYRHLRLLPRLPHHSPLSASRPEALRPSLCPRHLRRTRLRVKMAVPWHELRMKAEEV
jgi:hypothetical protein